LIIHTLAVQILDGRALSSLFEGSFVIEGDTIFN